MEKEETGIMIVKNGKGWAVTREDGHFTEHGWVNLTDATLYKSGYITKPTDVTYEGSPDTKELIDAKVVYVKKTIKIEIIA